MNKKGKIITIVSIASAAVLCLATSISVTLAQFFAADAVGQTVSYYGVREQSIYLDLGEWRNQDTTDQVTAKYYMYLYNSDTGAANWIEPVDTSTHLDNINIGGTGGGSGRYLKLFQVDNVKYNGFNFVRINQSASGPSWSDVWNQTKGITYSSSYNYYRITSMEGDSEYAKPRSGYSANMVYEVNSTLTFTAPS